MYEIRNTKNGLNVKNLITNKYVLKNSYDENVYEVTIEGENPELGAGFIYVVSEEKSMYFTLDGKFIIGSIFNNEHYEERKLKTVFDKFNDFLYKDLDSEEFVNYFNLFDDHFSFFADSNWNHIIYNEDEKEYYPIENLETKNNYFCFDYSGDLIMQAKTDGIVSGDEIYEQNFNNVLTPNFKN